jgi:hypothetical protein
MSDSRLPLFATLRSASSFSDVAHQRETTTQSCAMRDAIARSPLTEVVLIGYHID